MDAGGRATQEQLPRSREARVRAAPLPLRERSTQSGEGYFFLLAFLRPPERFFLPPLFFFGTFAPSRRASDKPIAIACLRLFTFFPERPLLSVPRLRSCIARFTFFEAFLPYFLAMTRSSRVSPPAERRQPFGCSPPPPAEQPDMNVNPFINPGEKRISRTPNCATREPLGG